MPATNSNSNTDRILREMFARLLNLEIAPDVTAKLLPVIDGVITRIWDDLDLETVQGQNMLRAVMCSMVAHGWGLGMHPFHNPNETLDGQVLEVRVSKDILMPMRDLRSLRYIKKDEQGRVKKALFEPDQNARIRQHIEDLLADVGRRWDQDPGEGD